MPQWGSSRPVISAGLYDTLLAALSPVGWWKLNDAVGSSTAADSSGNGTTGNCTAVTFGGAGPIAGDTSASFNSATSSIVDIANNSFTNLTGTMSLIAWVNTVSAAVNQQACGRSYLTSYYFNTTTTVGQGVSLYSSNVQLAGANPINDGKWHMFVATISGTAGNIYLDGAPLNSGTVGTLTSTTDHFFIGKGLGTGPNFFTGSIAQVALFNTVISAANVAALYAASPQLSFPGVAAVLTSPQMASSR